MSATTKAPKTFIGHIGIDGDGNFFFTETVSMEDLPEEMKELTSKDARTCAYFTELLSGVIASVDNRLLANELLESVVDAIRDFTYRKMYLKKKTADEHVHTKEYDKTPAQDDTEEEPDPCDECDGCTKSAVISIDKDDVYDLVKAAVHAIADTVKEVLEDD